MTYPILTFKLQGQEQVSSVFTGIKTFYQQGFSELAVLVFLCVIVAPSLRILFGIYLFLPLYLGKKPFGFERIFPRFSALAPWAMVEVYVLSLIVAYVKLTDLATIVIGPASFAFMALMAVTTWLSASQDRHAVWKRIAPESKASVRDTQLCPHTPSFHLSCHRCGLTTMAAPAVGARAKSALHCPRCGSELHHRKPNSINRAWALLAAAAICYIPANVLPIMTVISFGAGSPSTILSGVGELLELGMYPVAILVFVASIFVPVLKIMVMSYLLISVQRRSTWRRRERTILYRITETVGRWSMLDIFMISILAGLVQLASLATIAPEPGAIFFAAVVILTMLAASAFDARLIWDVATHGDRN